MKRVLSILLTAVLLITTATFASASTPAIMPAAETQATGEEPAADREAQVGEGRNRVRHPHADGSMASMYVVNHLETPADGIYTDYGNYTDIQNLTDSQEPTVRGTKFPSPGPKVKRDFTIRHPGWRRASLYLCVRIRARRQAHGCAGVDRQVRQSGNHH